MMKEQKDSKNINPESKKKRKKVSAELFELAESSLFREIEDHKKTKEELKQVKEELYYLRCKYIKDTGKSPPVDLKPFDVIILENEIKRLTEELNTIKSETQNSKIETIEQKPSKIRKESTGRKRNSNISNTDMLELRKQGLSIRQIAAKTGLSNVTVQKALKK